MGKLEHEGDVLAVGLVATLLRPAKVENVGLAVAIQVTCPRLLELEQPRGNGIATDVELFLCLF